MSLSLLSIVVSVGSSSLGVNTLNFLVFIFALTSSPPVIWQHPASLSCSSTAEHLIHFIPFIIINTYSSSHHYHSVLIFITGVGSSQCKIRTEWKFREQLVKHVAFSNHGQWHLEAAVLNQKAGGISPGMVIEELMLSCQQPLFSGLCPTDMTWILSFLSALKSGHTK